MSTDWQPLEKKVLDRLRQIRQETTSAGAGGYEVPFGGEPLRPIPPYENVRRRKRAKRRIREMLDLDDN